MLVQDELSVPDLVAGIQLQTFKRSYEQILAGHEPWYALGNFMHQFFGAYKQFRADLICEAIAVPERPSPEEWRWAVFCAASVEYLCQKYDLPIPVWSLNNCFKLAEPWYYDLAGDLPEVQIELRETTPEAFARRNVFCGDSVYRNKYEYTGRRGRLKIA